MNLATLLEEIANAHSSLEMELRHSTLTEDINVYIELATPRSRMELEISEVRFDFPDKILLRYNLL